MTNIESDKTMRIAIIEKTYAEERLILSVKGNEDVQHIYCQDKWHMRIKRNSKRFYEIYKPLLHPNVDGYHVFNSIMLTCKPWCANFETIMPRG